MRSYGGLLEPNRGQPYTAEIYVYCRTFHMQVVLVYSEWFRRNSVLKCVLQPKTLKNSLKPPIFGGSRSFKVIDVGTTGKLVGSACYDTQQVCVYLQPFSC